MRHAQGGRWRGIGVAALLGLFAVGSIGCSGFVNVLALPAIFTGGENIPPEVKLGGNRADPTKVLVLSFANTDLRWGNDSVDDELTAMLSSELSKDPNLKTVPERKVRAWRDLHPRWASKSLQDIGEEFEADYVILLEVTEFEVSEPKSPFLLQGKSKVRVKVHDVKKDNVIHRDEFARNYPARGPIPLTDVPSQESFKLRFLQTVAKELSWKFIPHPVSEMNTRDPI
jgi:hypothetical protein